MKKVIIIFVLSEDENPTHSPTISTSASFVASDSKRCCFRRGTVFKRASNIWCSRRCLITELNMWSRRHEETTWLNLLQRKLFHIHLVPQTKEAIRYQCPDVAHRMHRPAKMAPVVYVRVSSCPGSHRTSV